MKIDFKLNPEILSLASVGASGFTAAIACNQVLFDKPAIPAVVSAFGFGILGLAERARVLRGLQTEQNLPSEQKAEVEALCVQTKTAFNKSGIAGYFSGAALGAVAAVVTDPGQPLLSAAGVAAFSVAAYGLCKCAAKNIREVNRAHTRIATSFLPPAPTV